jgi:tellurite resistance protein TerC
MMVPAWVWAVSAGGLVAAVAAEIMLTGRPGRGGFTARRAVAWVAVYVSLAAACGLAIGVTAGWVTASQFYAGYLTEYSLSVDNLFVFAVIMTWFAVPPARRPRVLLLGIGLALAMRSAVIVAGAAALNRFDWLFYPLGGVLLWTAAGLIGSARAGPERQAERHTRLTAWLQRRPWVRGRIEAGGAAGAAGAAGAVPMLLLAAVIGLADLLFAFDSIPAVFGITTSAALVVACNAFALMGLRQLYVLVAGVLSRIPYLDAGLGVICAFIGVKLLLRAARGPGEALIPSWLSVLVVVAVLAVTFLAGVAAGRRPLSAGQRAMLERRFAVVDTDGNGMWQRDDGQLLTRRLCEAFGLAADSAAGQAMATAQRDLFDAMLSHMDANHDAQISRDEFVSAVGRAIKDRPCFDDAVRTTARALIAVADADGNGVLDTGEYTRLAAVYGVGAEEAGRAFGRFDRDRNGTLDIAELTAAISQFFASRNLGAAGRAAAGYG